MERGGRDGTRYGRREGGIERRMDSARKGGKRQGRYPEGALASIYSIFTNHPTTRPLPLILCHYK